MRSFRICRRYTKSTAGRGSSWSPFRFTLSRTIAFRRGGRTASTPFLSCLFHQRSRGNQRTSLAPGSMSSAPPRTCCWIRRGRSCFGTSEGPPMLWRVKFGSYLDRVPLPARRGRRCKLSWSGGPPSQRSSSTLSSFCFGVTPFACQLACPAGAQPKVVPLDLLPDDRALGTPFDSA